MAESFTDENGAFSQFGPDSTGNREKLRDGDGVGFTPVGYRKLAGLVTAEIKRDLAAARAERAVPLAGTEVEQKRINPDKAGVTAVVASKSVLVKEAREHRASAAASALPAQQVSATAARPATVPAEQKAETTRISLKLAGISGREDVTQVELVRPAISAAIIALLTRKETVDAVQSPYDLLADDVGDGVSVSTIVAGLPETANSTKRRGPTNQAAYSAVWVKGERLPSKPGRADDFVWPKPAADFEPVTQPAGRLSSPERSKTSANNPAPKTRERAQSAKQ